MIDIEGFNSGFNGIIIKSCEVHNNDLRLFQPYGGPNQIVEITAEIYNVDEFDMTVKDLKLLRAIRLSESQSVTDLYNKLMMTMELTE